MALANVTHKYLAGERPSAPLITVVVEFDGDAAYPTGGTAGFKDSVKAALKTAGVNIGTTNVVAVLPVDTKGYGIAYNRTDDKLLVLQCAGSGNPMAEVSNGADLHTTRFTVCVIIK
ncbi:hypothetical protein EKK58_05670 [Candidatus Dependentiae bacterium]|nr:MAG: hypothetical protein EKK58_05670 [Candidatus Dependentiae bacterium]